MTTAWTEEDHRLKECATPLIMTGMHAQRPEHPRVPALLWTQTPLRAARLYNLHACDGCVAHHAGGRVEQVHVAGPDAAEVLAAVATPTSSGDTVACGKVAAKTRALRKESNSCCLAAAAVVRGLSSRTVPSGSHSQSSEVLAVNQAIVAASCFHRRASDQDVLLQD
jgi:hypothetical protein